ncbi:MAG: hypothetical protein WD360_04885 [Nitriliruptoraceae bacterium]
MNNNSDIRIVIADPVSAIRTSFAELFTIAAGWHVVAQAVDAFDAVSAARRTHADVVLLASQTNGLTITEVRALLKPSGVLVVGLIDRPEEYANHDGPSVSKSVPFTVLHARMSAFLNDHFSRRSPLGTVTEVTR